MFHLHFGGVVILKDPEKGILVQNGTGGGSINGVNIYNKNDYIIMTKNNKKY